MYIESYTRIDFIRDMLDFFRVKEEIQKREFKIYDEVLTTKDNIDWHSFKKYIFKNVKTRHNMPAPSYFLELLPTFRVYPKGIPGDKIIVSLNGENGYHEMEFTEVAWAKNTLEDIKNKYGKKIKNIQRIKKEMC